MEFTSVIDNIRELRGLTHIIFSVKYPLYMVKYEQKKAKTQNHL